MIVDRAECGTFGAESGRILLCSGKVYYDLAAERTKLGDASIAIVRVEQLYPFPKNLIAEELNRFATRLTFDGCRRSRRTWAGGLYRAAAAGNARVESAIRYAGRPPSASPATGSHTIHQMEQQRLIREALSG